MTREFKIGDLVRYDFDEIISEEGYVIGHAPDPFDPDNGEVYLIIAADAWHADLRDLEALTFLSEGHIETAYRLRERWKDSPFAQLLPLPEAPARA
ncbi:hypothetical protein [Microvirga sp. CF3016]|uniref:hypothetical protein n=1 Tax=Microvirga sp. CF3016 TaxID=3110181 RepID=UPI002E7797C8|nr:hypothetical protein [Microvirga sp. CF3016]MEE1611126.1 hypothetical protein [Microvirga sp. CF3016]